LSSNYDVLCFEKAFDGRARNAIYAVLRQRYPYSYGPANSSRFLRTNSGVWILSRFPLTDLREIAFRDCRGIECLTAKGALMATAGAGTRQIHIVATHLQGESGHQYTESRQQVRNRQIQQIKNDLLSPFARPGVPIIVAGDFVTPRRLSPGMPESEPYQQLLATLQVENGTADRITLDDNTSHNDLAEANSGRMAELDYVLFRKGAASTTPTWDRAIFRRSDWDSDKNRQDLSYRYAVSFTLEFK
jgi:endonuclease/exonuclease/phosphatase family metal-dependent hydrolase